MARRSSISVKSFLPLVILLIVGAIALWYFKTSYFDVRSKAAVTTDEVNMSMRKPSGESSGIYANVTFWRESVKTYDPEERPRMSIWLGPEQQLEYPTKNSEIKEKFLRMTHQFLYAGSCAESGNKILDLIEGYVYISDEESAYPGKVTLINIVQQLGFQSPLDFMTSPNYSIRAYNKSDSSLYACADMSTKISSGSLPPTSPPNASSPPGSTTPPNTNQGTNQCATDADCPSGMACKRETSFSTTKVCKNKRGF